MLTVFIDCVDWSSDSLAGISCQLGMLLSGGGFDGSVWNHLEAHSFIHSLICLLSGLGLLTGPLT